MEWHRLRVFYYVAKAQSITRAAAEINIAQPAVTRTIQQLEYQAKAPLFIRHPRGLTLTKQGEILFEHVKNMMMEVDLARNQLSGLSDKASGSLRITTTYAFSSTVLFEYLCEFSKKYPNIKLQLICDDADLDLTKREADISIRPYDPNGEELEQIFLHRRTLHLYASNQYLEEMGIPQEPENLDNHRLITFENPNNITPYLQTTWNLTVGMIAGKRREAFMTVNSTECLFQAAEAGLGIIGMSDDSSLLKRGTLVRILPKLNGPVTEMYFTYPKSLKNLAIINIFKEYLLKKFGIS